MPKAKILIVEDNGIMALDIQKRLKNTGYEVTGIALYKHQMERKLKESQKWFEVTLASIGDAVICSDCDGRVTYRNQVALTP